MLLLALTVACSGVFGPQTSEDLLDPDDRDGDGYSALAAGGSDCDDDDPEVNPHAREVCEDLIDNDCDGVTDDRGEGQVPWFEDLDGDGWGSVPGLEACANADLGSGLVPRGGDCDDEEILINPGEEDYCDLVDADCDGTVDEDGALGQRSQLTQGSLQDAVLTATRWAQEQPGDVQGRVYMCATDNPLPVGTTIIDGGSVIVGTFEDAPEPATLRSLNGRPIFDIRNKAEVVLFGLALVDATDAAIRIAGESEVALSDLLLRDNVRAVDATESTLSVIDSEITANGSPVVPCPGVRVSSMREEVSMSGVRLHENTGQRGGGLCVEGSRVDLTATVVIERNVVEAEGGGVYLSGGTVLLRGPVKNNTAATGGGIYATDGAIVEGAANSSPQIAENTAAEGGGAYLRDATLVAGQVLDNTATLAGAGVYLWSDSRVEETSISGNETSPSGQGGGLYATAGESPEKIVLRDVRLEDNVARLGGGLFVSEDVVFVLRESTLWSNGTTIPFGGGGAFVAKGAILSSQASDWGVGDSDNNFGNDDVAVAREGDIENFVYGEAATFTCASSDGCVD